MTTTRKDVFQQMGEVRLKKVHGSFYMMNERIEWIAEHRDTVAVSHRFQDIKMQKISPEGKSKIHLQVVLHDGNSSTFHYVNRNGPASQIADRDKVKELLQQLLSNFKRKVDKELEEKNQILTSNPIHFGHAFLSPSFRLLIIYIFVRGKLDVNRFIEAVQKELTDPDVSIGMFYDSFAQEVTDKLKGFYRNLSVGQLSESGEQTDLLYWKIDCPENDIFTSRDLFKPLVSAFECELELNPAWSGQFPSSHSSGTTGKLC